MHIVFVEKGYPRASGSVGGAGTYVQLHAMQLIKMGYQISVLCGKMTDGTSFFKDGNLNVYPIISTGSLHYYLSKVPVFKVFAPLLKYLEAGWRTHRFLIQLNKKNRIDIIEYSEGGDFWNAVFKRFPYIVHLHGSAYTFNKNAGQSVGRSDWYQRKAEHYFIKQAKTVVSPCYAMVELVEQEMRKSIKNAQVIPYPIDETLIKRQPDENIPPKKDKIIIFFASRNDPVKGGELLIDALKQLPPELTGKIEVRFYGYLPQQDTSEFDFLEKHKFVPKKELLKAYEEADICVIPSYFDNSPNTVYEAMAAGKVIVASSVGGIPELIDDGSTGFLFQAGNTKMLKEKLEKAIKICKNQPSIGMKAREKIISITANEDNLKKRITIFRNLKI